MVALAASGCTAHSSSLDSLGSLSTSKQDMTPASTAPTPAPTPSLPKLLTEGADVKVSGDALPKSVLLPNDATKVHAVRSGHGRHASWRVQLESTMPCTAYHEQLTGYGFGQGLTVGREGFAVRGRPYDLLVLCEPGTMLVLANPYMT